MTHRNVYPNGNEGAFLVYRRAMTGRKFKEIVDAGVEKGHKVPVNGQGVDMCVSFHVIGNCTSYCSRRADHNGLEGGTAHTAGEDDALLKWCKVCIPVE